MNNARQLLDLISEYPDLPIIPMVDQEVVADDCYTWWMGEWGRCEVTEYYIGRERVHFKDDDEEDVLGDLVGCRYYCDPNGNDITELSDKEWDELYQSVPWTKAIVVYIGV